MSTALAPVGASVLSSIPPRTLAELVPVFCGWFGTVRGRTTNTVKSYAEDLAAFARFCASAGVTRPEMVTFQLVEMYLARLTTSGLKATTANRQLYAIRSFFKFLRRNGYATVNPADDVFSLPTPKRLPKSLSIPQQERLLAHLAALESLEGRRNYALVATALFCGLRVEELATLRLTDLDLEAGHLRVVGKGDVQREVPVVPRLAAILRDYLDTVRPHLVTLKVTGWLRRGHTRRGLAWQMFYTVDGRTVSEPAGTRDETEARARLADRVRDLRIEQESPYLFVRATPTGSYFRYHQGRPLLTRTIYAVIRTKISAIVGTHVHPHMFRHSFASRLRENGAPLELIQQALGHVNISTTLIYAHVSTKKQRQDIAKYLEGGA